MHHVPAAKAPSQGRGCPTALPVPPASSLGLALLPGVPWERLPTPVCG